MELTITSALALFTLIGIATGVFFIAKRLHAPFTVLLVLAGLLLVPIANIPYLNSVFGFIDDLVLTPELLFYMFLPILIFESGFNMSIRKMLDSAWTISFLAIGVLCLSIVTISTLIYFAMPLIGINIPFIVALLFGAIISPTDPVAALALFKELGVPRKLALIFEGESLFNDGTAMAAFLVILAVAVGGYHGTETLIEGSVTFFAMIIVGAIFGLLMATVVSRILKYTKGNQFVTITILLISAHFVFILSELINETGVIHASPIIATTVSSLFLGNYSRTSLSTEVDHYLEKVIEHLAFVTNSLVFLMAGLLFASSGINFLDLWLPILITILIVASARAFAIYAVLTPLNFLKLEARIPTAWKNMLAWSSLRGALSIIIVLMIPQDFTIAGWDYTHSPRDFLLALTIGCILATLFIKAPLIKPFMNLNKISNTSPLREAHEADLSVYFLLAATTRLHHYTSRGFLSEKQYTFLSQKLEEKLKCAEEKRELLVKKYGRSIFDQSLHLTMIHVEKAALKKLFMNEEINERSYRVLVSKLNLQEEKIEKAQHEEIDPKQYTDRKDIFDRLVNLISMPFDKNRNTEATPVQKFEYYRAQMIMARKAYETAEKMQTEFNYPVFIPETYSKVSALYAKYKDGSGKKAAETLKKYKDCVEPRRDELAIRSLALSGSHALGYLEGRGLVDAHTQQNILEFNQFDKSGLEVLKA